MFKETPAAAAPSVATASGSGPAARPFSRRPTSRPSFQIPVAPASRRWSDPVSDIERTLYGALMEDVTFLRKRGFGIHREKTGFRVGNRLVDADGLEAIAARERRLIEKS